MQNSLELGYKNTGVQVQREKSPPASRGSRKRKSSGELHSASESRRQSEMQGQKRKCRQIEERLDKSTVVANPDPEVTSSARPWSFSWTLFLQKPPDYTESHFPVPLKLFQRLTDWQDVVQHILEDFKAHTTVDFLEDDEMKERVLLNYYIQFYELPQIREMYPITLKPCPVCIKNKLMSVPLSEYVQLESENHTGSEAGAVAVTAQRQRENIRTPNKCDVDQTNTLKSGPSKNTENQSRKTKFLHKSQLSDEFLLKYIKRTINAEMAQTVLDRVKSQLFSLREPQPEIPLPVTHRRRSKPQILSVETIVAAKPDVILNPQTDQAEQATAVNKPTCELQNRRSKPQILSAETIGAAKPNVILNPQTDPSEQATAVDKPACALQRNLDEVKAIYFRDDNKQYSLPYLLRFHRGQKRYVLAAIMTMKKDEFKLCTHIHKLPRAFDDEDLLKSCYEFTMQNPKVWPRNLFIRIVDLYRFIKARGIVFHINNLADISPKLLHWSDLVTTTNYDDCVRLDYYRTNGDDMPEELLEERRRCYYNKCWLHDVWIRFAPKINAETQMTIKKALKEVMPAIEMNVGKTSGSLVMNKNTPLEENKKEESDLPVTDILNLQKDVCTVNVCSSINDYRTQNRCVELRIGEPLSSPAMPRTNDLAIKVSGEHTNEDMLFSKVDELEEFTKSQTVEINYNENELRLHSQLQRRIIEQPHLQESTTLGQDVMSQQKDSPQQQQCTLHEETSQQNRSAIIQQQQQILPPKDVPNATLPAPEQRKCYNQLNPNITGSNLQSLAPSINELQRQQKMQDRIAKLITRFEGNIGSPIAPLATSLEGEDHVPLQNLQFDLTGEVGEVNCEQVNLVAKEDLPTKESSFQFLSPTEEICAPTSSYLQAEERGKKQDAIPKLSKRCEADIAPPSAVAFVNKRIKKEKDLVPIRNLQFDLTGEDCEVKCQHVNFDLVVVDCSSQESSFQLLSEEICAPTSPFLQAEESGKVENSLFVQNKESAQMKPPKDKNTKTSQRSDKAIGKAIATGHVTQRGKRTCEKPGNINFVPQLTHEFRPLPLVTGKRVRVSPSNKAVVNSTRNTPTPPATMISDELTQCSSVQLRKPQSQSLAHALSGDTTLFNSTRLLQIVNEQHQQPSQCHKVGSKGEQHQQQETSNNIEVDQFLQFQNVANAPYTLPVSNDSQPLKLSGTYAVEQILNSQTLQFAESDEQAYEDSCVANKSCKTIILPACKPHHKVTILHRNLDSLSYFRSLSLFNIQEYELPTNGIGQPYLTAKISCNEFKTQLYGNFLDALFAFCPADIMHDFKTVLYGLKEFHYSMRQSAECEDLRVRVLSSFLRCETPFTHCILEFDCKTRQYSRCRSITGCNDDTRLRHSRKDGDNSTVGDLSKLIKPSILKRIARLKPRFCET